MHQKRRPFTMSADEVMQTFNQQAKKLGQKMPLPQLPVKHVTALTLDVLVQKGFPDAPGPRLFTAPSIAEKLKSDRIRTHCKVIGHQSMLDHAVYLGTQDPFFLLAAAESEAYKNHDLPNNAHSENSDYLWDLFKLIQLQSPLRLFVARVRGPERVRLLRKRIAWLVSQYPECFRDGDRLYSIVLPAAVRGYDEPECDAWEGGPNGIVPLV